MAQLDEVYSKAFGCVTSLVLWGGLAVVVALTIIAEHRVITAVMGIIVVLVLLMITGRLWPKNERSGHAGPNEQDPGWRTTPNMGEEEPLPVGEFPVFSPDEIDFDDSMFEEKFEDDTLLCDSTGHGVDLEDALFSEGLGVAFGLLELEPSEWSMTPWGYELLFAIEAILAVGGRPSRSRECGRMRSWARRTPYEVSPELASRLLDQLGWYLEAIRKDPVGSDVVQDEMDQIEVVAERMKSRISQLL